MLGPPKKSPTYFVPALEKGLDILEALAHTRVPQSLSQLARTLNRGSSELFRMLDALGRRGYILKDPLSGKYRLSLKLYELAHTHSPVGQLLRASTSPMRELAESARESTHLSILSRGALVVLAQTESPEKVRLSVEVGARFSPVRTVSGRLLLAHLEPQELADVLVTDPNYRRFTEARRKEFGKVLEAIRRRRFSTAANETYMGVQDIAVLVGNPRIGLTAALAVSSWMAPGKSPPLGKLRAGLQACAARITRDLGVASQ